LTALNTDFNITNITSSNPAFQVSPESFTLLKGQSIDLIISYTPVDSGYSYTKFTINNSKCPEMFYASGSCPGKKPKNKTLKLIQPNGGEIFSVGSDTIITWEGVSKTDTVQLEYSINNGNDWIPLTDSGYDLEYLWRDIPKPASNQCKVRVRQVDNMQESEKPGTLYLSLNGHSNIVNNVSWSPDGTKVVTSSNDKSAIIWNVITGEKLYILTGIDWYVNDAIWSPDGSKIAISSVATLLIINSETGEKIYTLQGHISVINNMSWSHDSKRIASVSADLSAIIWDATLGVKIHTLIGHTGSVFKIEWSHDDSRIATSGNDMNTIIWDAATGVQLFILKGHLWDINKIAWSPDDSRIATASNDMTAIIWDAFTGDILYKLNGHKSQIMDVCWSPDGKKFATASSDPPIIIWDAATGDSLNQLRCSYASVSRLSWNYDGSLMASVSGKNLVVWDAVNLQIKHTFSEHSENINDFSWSKDFRKIATVSNDYTSKIWDIEIGERLSTLGGHKNNINLSKWSPDGRYIATMGSDNKVIIWDSHNGVNINSINGNISNFNNFCWSPDSRRVAIAGSDRKAEIFDINSGKILITLEGHTSNINNIIWSKDNYRIATASSDGTAKIWDSNTGALIQSLSGHTKSVNDICWSPDNSRIATASADYTAKIWDSGSGNIIHTISGHSKEINRICWSPDGSKIATAGRDNSIIIWNSETVVKLQEISVYIYSNSNICWSPDGKQIAAPSYTYGYTWIAETGEVALTLDGHIKNVSKIRWNPEGTLIATSSSDNNTIIWDAVTGKELLTLLGHIDDVSDVDWSPDGLRVVTASYDKTAKIWNVDEPVFQQDISDSLFSIVEPSATSIDIDMKQCLVGATKDSIITAFITNNGTYKCRIDSIFIENGDAAQFSVISRNFPVELPVGGTYSLEVGFRPASVGIKNADLFVKTQSDTLKQKITGEGIEPTLAAMAKFIDFGKVEVGDTKDTLAYILENLSSSVINITSTQIIGPDKNQFFLLDSLSFSMNPGEKKQLNFRFQPKYIGRTSTVVDFYYSGGITPLKAQLYGQGIGGLVYITDDSASPGEKRNIKLKMEGIKPAFVQSIAKEFYAKLRYNSTLFAPTNRSLFEKSYLDSAYLYIRKPVTANEDLFDFDIIAGLGDAEFTSIDFDEFGWLGTAGDTVDYETETQSGSFKLHGICREGGSRLFNPLTKAEFLIIPNPAGDEVKIEVNLIEEGISVVEIYNINGELCSSLFFDGTVTGKQEQSVDLNNFAGGLYFAKFRTPTYFDVKKFIVV
ncbi:MAG: Choice-of-anchor protein, partial [Bacteroidota bacterium]|nr:Choice-of-anchor protein [Bacteroidota bacterium]